MLIGGGEYEDLATMVREATGAAHVVLVVIGGTRGTGMAQQVTAASTHEAARRAESMAEVLHRVANDMAADAAQLRNQAD